jgi:regulator of protease activity HflC (stomatin/prohibitin superfamily)
MKSGIIYYLIAIFVVAVVVVSLYSNRYTVGESERAVMYHGFSGEFDKENIIEPGTRYKFAWNHVYIYPVMTQLSDAEFDILDKSGHSLNVSVMFRFTPIPDKIGYLHESFGTSYKDVMVIPEVRSNIRQITGKYSAEEIYSTKRAEVEESARNEIKNVLQNNYVQLNELFIRSIDLPVELRNKLEKKFREQSKHH